MELSNLQPAAGSVHSDNFRRGRGHASGNGKTAGKGHNCLLYTSPSLYTDVFLREASQTETLRISLQSI